MVRLNENFELCLPEKIVAGLCLPGSPQQVCFAAAEYMRCYPLEGIDAYMSALRNWDNPNSHAQVRFTLTHGVADIFDGCKVRIPEAFCRAYKVTPSMTMQILGHGDYIELRGDVV